MKTKILVDTSCGIGREEAEKLGYEMIALPFLLDEIEYDEDKLSKSEFYEKLKKSNDIHTSTATMDRVMKVIDRLLEENDKVLYFPITSGLSSSYNTAVAISEKAKYKDKLIVVNHRTISVVERAMLNDVRKLLERGVDPTTIKNLIENNSKNNRVYIAVDTLEYLKRGGRISLVSATLGSILNVKPVLYSDGGKFEVVKKARGFKAAEDDLILLVKNSLSESFNGESIDKFRLGVAYTECIEEAKAFSDRVSKEFNTELILDELSTVIACHIGTGAIALAIYRVLDEC